MSAEEKLKSEKIKQAFSFLTEAFKDEGLELAVVKRDPDGVIAILPASILMSLIVPKSRG